MVKKYRFKFTELTKTVAWAQMLLVRVEIKRIVLAMQEEIGQQGFDSPKVHSLDG